MNSVRTWAMLVALASITVCSPRLDAAPLQPGDVIKLDFSTTGDGDGGSIATWNQVHNGLNTGGISAGNVKLHGGGTVDGVTIAFTNLVTTSFNNDGNSAAWGGTGGDPYYILAADDIYFHNQAADLTVTFGGLDPTLRYTARVYSLIGHTATSVEQFTVSDGTGSRVTSNNRGFRWNAATLEASNMVFKGLAANGSNQIQITVNDVSAVAYPLNAIVLEAQQSRAIDLGDVIGVDFGPTYTSNWNNFTADGSKAAGSVVTTSGDVLSGVSLTMSRVGGGGYNNDGTNNWIESPSGSLPDVPDSATTDITFGSGVGASLNLTIAGLDPLLAYNIDTVSAAAVGLTFQETTTVTGSNGVFMSTLTRSAANGGAYHSFLQIRPDALGTILLSFTNDVNNPIINAVRIEAVQPIPEPATFVLGIIAASAIGLLLYRRRAAIR